MHSAKGFFIKLVLFSIVLLALSYLMSCSFFPEKINRITYYVIAYFSLITVVFQAGLFYSSKGNPQTFIRYYMGATAIKLMVHLVVILTYCLLINRSMAANFIINFAVFYLLFTVFEVVLSMKQFGRKS